MNVFELWQDWEEQLQWNGWVDQDGVCIKPEQLVELLAARLLEFLEDDGEEVCRLSPGSS